MQLECDFIDFKKKKNHATYIINQARGEFYTKFIKENNAVQSRLFKAAKKLLGKNDELAYLDYSDNVALVNVIGRYFVDKIDGIRSDIDAMDVALDQYSHCSRSAVPKDLEVDDIQTLSA